jgi:hypothetical protein
LCGSLTDSGSAFPVPYHSKRIYRSDSLKQGTRARYTVNGGGDQAEPASPAWVNIDETTEIGLDQMFAGGPAIEDSANTSPQLIRFAVKANHVEYRYVAEKQYFLPNQG